MNTQDYRFRIYEYYATNFQDANRAFDHEASAPGEKFIAIIFVSGRR